MKKVLMIATCNFWTTHNDGGRQCSYRNYNILRQIFGVENVYVCMLTNDAFETEEHMIILPTYANKWQQIQWTLKLRNGYSKRTEKDIIQFVDQGNFDYIWFDRSTLGSLCSKIQTHAMKIVFFHNVEKKYIKNKIFHDDIGYLVSYPAFVWNEWKAIGKADKIICLNKRDSELINKIYGRQADFLLPISFADSFNNTVLETDNGNKDKNKNLLFVGSLFQPNIEGLDWFVENVMSQLPDINLKIVGKGMERKANDWSRDNVQVIGTVQDVAMYYLEADAVILPIFYGDGMKVKTAEALMYGKVVFGTKEAFEGYEIEKQPDIIECNEKDEYVYEIKKYFALDRTDYFSKSNRKLFLNKYENGALIKKLGDFLGA